MLTLFKSLILKATSTPYNIAEKIARIVDEAACNKWRNLSETTGAQRVDRRVLPVSCAGNLNSSRKPVIIPPNHASALFQHSARLNSEDDENVRVPRGRCRSRSPRYLVRQAYSLGSRARRNRGVAMASENESDTFGDEGTAAEGSASHARKRRFTVMVRLPPCRAAAGGQAAQTQRHRATDAISHLAPFTHAGERGAE
ncbi:hypothetical protein MRX96_043954 [Rhipicephalus microplus]